MRVLWITNSLLPEAIAKIRKEEIQQWKTTGSWIIGAANALTKEQNIQLYISRHCVLCHSLRERLRVS